MEKLQTIFLYIFPLSSLLATFIVLLCVNISGKETEVENMPETPPDKTVVFSITSPVQSVVETRKNNNTRVDLTNYIIRVSGRCLPSPRMAYVVMLCVTI